LLNAIESGYSAFPQNTLIDERLLLLYLEAIPALGQHKKGEPEGSPEQSAEGALLRK